MPRKARDRAVESSPEVGSEEEKFPEKLWRLAKDTRIKCIHWLEDGDTILIYQKSFTQELLNRKEFFKTKSFDSVVRNLNLYGFRKVQLDCVPEQTSKRPRKPSSENLLYYKHPFFHRDKPDSLHRVRRPSCSKSAVAERRRCRLVQALTALRANLPDNEDRPDLGQLLNTIGGGDAPPTKEPGTKTPRKKTQESKPTTPSSTDGRKKSTSKKRPRGRLQSPKDIAEEEGSIACMQKMTITPIDNPSATLRNNDDLQDDILDMEVDADVTFPSPAPEAIKAVPAAETRRDVDLNHYNATPYLGDSSLHHNDPFGGSYYPLGESDSTWCHGVPPQCYGDDHVVSCTLPNRQWAWQAYGDHLSGYPYAWPAPYHTTAAPHSWTKGANQVPVPYEMGNNGGEHARQDMEPATTTTITPLATVDVAAITSNTPGVDAPGESPTVTLTVL
ncbi:uncharacterized protein [Branchiostoma lanceolatum]|uniref:uncharacterized protein n=1 Tax=Branchiostoma lanceolatum TaxID=7740 RepID=UPI003455693E